VFKNKLALAAIVLILLGPAATHAMNRQIDEATLEALVGRAEENKTRLGLSAEQEEKVNPILEASREKRLAILERFGFGRGSKPSLSLREKTDLAKAMKAVRQDTEAALSRHLSDNQMKIYKDIQDERREQLKKYIKSRK
jgi:small-conductance mechanosensitive channel